MVPESESHNGESDASKYIRDTSLEQEAKDTVQQAAEEMGEPLSRDEYTDWQREQGAEVPCIETVARRLDVDGTTWTDIAGVVGIEATKSWHKHTDEEIKIALRKAAEEMGEPLTMAKYKSWRDAQSSDTPSYTSVYRLGDGGWIEVCESVGVTPGDQSGSNEQYTREELKSAVQQAVEEMGEPLSYNKYSAWVQRQEDEYPTATPIYRRLGDGDWRDACRSVGVETPTNPE